MNFHREPFTFVSQVHLKVQDIERSLSFYQDIIGFQILERNESTAKLTADGKTVLLSVEQPDNVTPKPPSTTGLYHLALLLPKRSDLGKILMHFLQNRYPLQGASDHLVSEALYLADPDGNGIEIYSDRSPAEWSWRKNEVVMPSEPLDAENLLAAATGAPWNGLPVDTVMGHVHLHVADLEINQDFYVQGLGFEVVSRYGNQASFISTGKYHHHIALNIWNGVGALTPPIHSVGLESFSLKFKDEEKRNKIIAQLTNLGASISNENGVFVTSDPSGNRIRLIV